MAVPVSTNTTLASLVMNKTTEAVLSASNYTVSNVMDYLSSSMQYPSNNNGSTDGGNYFVDRNTTINATISSPNNIDLSSDSSTLDFMVPASIGGAVVGGALIGIYVCYKACINMCNKNHTENVQTKNCAPKTVADANSNQQNAEPISIDEITIIDESPQSKHKYGYSSVPRSEADAIK